MASLDNFKGSMFGLAIGDALGAPAEFMKPAEIKQTFGVLDKMVGGGWLNTMPGEYTDDTAMALCMARSFIEKQGFDLLDISQKYLEWYHTDPPDIGNCTRKALKNLDNGVSPVRSGTPAPDEGNGSVMRTAPLGLTFYKSSSLDSLSRQESSITHASSVCQDSCVLVNRFIKEILNGKSLKQAKKEVLKSNLDPNLLNLLNSKGRENPSGHVIQTLEAVFHTLFSTKSFEDAVVTIVNLGGDADTTAAITGAIAGAHYGFKSIPKKWLDKILDYEIIDKVSSDLFELSKKM